MSAFIILVLENGRQTKKLTTLEEFDFSSIRLGAGIKINEVIDQFNFNNKQLKIADGVSFDHAITLTQLQNVQNQLQTVLTDKSKEESFTSGGAGPHTVSTFSFDPSNSVRDIKVYLNDRKLFQGGSDDYVKSSGTAITLNFVPTGIFRITIRMEHPNTFAAFLLDQGFFVDYETGTTTNIVTLPQYNQFTNRLWVFRNGLYQSNNILVGDPLEKYLEFINTQVLTGVPTNAATVYEFVHDFRSPSFIQHSIVTVGSLTLPSYTQGDDSLLAFRNGLLLQTAGLAQAITQYVEATSTSITFLAPAISARITAVSLTTAPDWREDQDGVVGTTLTFSTPYTLGTDRLLLWRNGVTMHNDGTGDTITQYTEASTTIVTLAVAAKATDWFGAIHLV